MSSPNGQRYQSCQPLPVIAVTVTGNFPYLASSRLREPSPFGPSKSTTSTPEFAPVAMPMLKLYVPHQPRIMLGLVVAFLCHSAIAGFLPPTAQGKTRKPSAASLSAASPFGVIAALLGA